MRDDKKSQWPQLQRTIESVPLVLLRRYHPLYLLRRLVNRFVPYQPGIYILTYHTIVDPANAAKWEIAYDKGRVSRKNFEEQIAFLCKVMVPVSLTRSFELMAAGNPDRPYFVVTFDDGYSDVLKNAAPVLERFGVKPCVFVNGRYAQGHVYYRVLAALLTKNGYAGRLRSELVSRDGITAWSAEPLELFNQTKNLYTPGVVEDAVEAAYRACLGNPADLGVHLTVEEIRGLQKRGWEIGNHTFDHRLLSRLDANRIAETISMNEDFWRKENIQLIKALAIPNGALKDVNTHFERWLKEHDSVHALFCNGGVNFKFDRTQWLRFFAGNGNALSLETVIRAEIERTNRVWERM